MFMIRYDKEDLVWNVEDSRESLSSRRFEGGRSGLSCSEVRVI